MKVIVDIWVGFGAFVSLTKDDRRVSTGRFRAGEPAALEGVLDVAEANPAVFAVLGGVDGGNDPNTFEAALLRDKLRSAGSMVEFADALEALARDVRDTQMQLGADVRGPVLAAYEIAKVLSRHDTKAKSALAKTIDFYARDKHKQTPKE